MKPLVLGLGNDLLGDDGIGIHTARRVAGELSDVADVVESSLHGVALLDLLIGYEKAVIIDAITTGRHPPGTILELSPDDFRPAISPSPHYTGLPDMIRIARELQIDFPKEIRIIAVEIADASTVGGPMSPPVAAAMDELCRRAIARVRQWVGGDNSGQD